MRIPEHKTAMILAYISEVIFSKILKTIQINTSNMKQCQVITTIFYNSTSQRIIQVKENLPYLKAVLNSQNHDNSTQEQKCNAAAKTFPIYKAFWGASV